MNKSVISFKIWDWNDETNLNKSTSGLASWIVCFNFTGPIIVVVVGVSFVVVVQVVHCSLFIAISNDSMMLTQRKN